MISEDALSEVFQKNPLSEVVFEVRFPLNLRIPNEIYLLAEYLSSDLSQYGKEENLGPKGETFVSYVFINSQQTRLIRVAEDKLAVIFNQYTSFEVFEQSILEMTSWFCESFRVRYLDRIGLRYVNNIPLGKENYQDDLQRKIKLAVDLSIMPEYAVERFTFAKVVKKENYSLTLRNALIKHSPTNEFLYVIDTDVFIEGAIAISDLTINLKRMHDHAQVAFLTQITEEYKQEMRAEL